RRPSLPASAYPSALCCSMDERVSSVVSSPTPSRIACRTRAIWCSRPVPALSGRLPTLTGVSRLRLPPASSGCCDNPKVQVFHLHSTQQRLVAHQSCRPPTKGTGPHATRAHRGATRVRTCGSRKPPRQCPRASTQRRWSPFVTNWRTPSRSLLPCDRETCAAVEPLRWVVGDGRLPPPIGRFLGDANVSQRLPTALK